MFTAAGVACLAALGVAMAHVIPNVDAAPAFSNAVFLPVVAISGIVYGGDAGSGGALSDLARALPLVHLADGLHGAMVTGSSLADNAGGLAVDRAVAGVRGGLRGARVLLGEQLSRFGWRLACLISLRTNPAEPSSSAPRRVSGTGRTPRHLAAQRHLHAGQRRGRPVVAQQREERDVLLLVAVAVEAAQDALAPEADLLERALRAGVAHVGVGAEALQAAAREGEVGDERLGLEVEARPPPAAPEPRADDRAPVARAHSDRPVTPTGPSLAWTISRSSCSPRARRASCSVT